MSTPNTTATADATPDAHTHPFHGLHYLLHIPLAVAAAGTAVAAAGVDAVANDAAALDNVAAVNAD